MSEYFRTAAQQLSLDTEGHRVIPTGEGALQRAQDQATREAYAHNLDLVSQAFGPKDGKNIREYTTALLTNEAVINKANWLIDLLGEGVDPDTLVRLAAAFVDELH